MHIPSVASVAECEAPVDRGPLRFQVRHQPAGLVVFRPDREVIWRGNWLAASAPGRSCLKKVAWMAAALPIDHRGF